jgi:hypothetical protein
MADSTALPTEGYVVPITGLLALLFALLAGGSAYPAVRSGSVGLAALPIIFGAASLLCLKLRQRAVEATEAGERGVDDRENESE